ncbi:hypothetical protein [Streptomyces sp. NPDC060184]|uniref:hypothetical protein n=1 Tax=Streptomyces sp. NPDC060184 TaxID=3347064 RepID=UPI003668579D
MLSHLTTGAWWIIAACVTAVYLAAMNRCMPTRTARRRMFLVPVVCWVVLLPDAAVRGYSVPVVLYIYSSLLLMVVAMLAPVAKRVGADILEQEQNPWRKVPLNTFSLYWFTGVIPVCVTAAVCFWP